MSNLSFITGEALIEELLKRYDAGIIVLMQDRTANEEYSVFRWWGGATALGLLDESRDRIKKEREDKRRCPK